MLVGQGTLWSRENPGKVIFTRFLEARPTAQPPPALQHHPTGLCFANSAQRGAAPSAASAGRKKETTARGLPPATAPGRLRFTYEGREAPFVDKIFSPLVAPPPKGKYFVDEGPPVVGARSFHLSHRLDVYCSLCGSRFSALCPLPLERANGSMCQEKPCQAGSVAGTSWYHIFPNTPSKQHEAHSLAPVEAIEVREQVAPARGQLARGLLLPHPLPKKKRSYGNLGKRCSQCTRVQTEQVCLPGNLLIRKPAHKETCA